MSEIKIHRALHHQNIVQFSHFFENDEFVHILLELCPNQSLSDLLRRRKRLHELEAQCYLSQILTGIKYLHSHRVIHRDIKLGNIFLSGKMEVKIGDLGLAAKLEYEGERKRTICGTPNYIAPEILEGKNGHSYECDVWSFGVLMYTLLVGRPPFETKDVKTTYRRIKMNLYTFPENVEVSPEAKALIQSILVIDYTRRPNLEQIASHDFFTKNSFPRYLPFSTLAVPLAQGYLKQFLTCQSDTDRGVTVRASSQEDRKDVVDDNTPSKKRNKSREARKETNPETKITPYFSSYTGTENDGPDMWVTKWLDYSSRYGVGYILSNKSVGVIFNDSSRIVLSPNELTFQYISNTALGESINTFTIDEFPADIHKKVMLLQLFKKQLQNDKTNSPDIEKPFHHVKKWSSTPHAMIFRLTNKVIQVCFRDSTELLLSSEKKYVTFVNKIKETSSFPLGTAMECGNKQLIKRLKYSKEVLTTMLKGRS
jgi:polo-like kinase 1